MFSPKRFSHHASDYNDSIEQYRNILSCPNFNKQIFLLNFVVNVLDDV